MKIQIIIFLLLVILILSICLIIFASIASIKKTNILKYGGGIKELEAEILKQKLIYKKEISHLTEYIKYILNIQILDENIKQKLIEDIYKKLEADIPIREDTTAANLSNSGIIAEELSNDKIINSIKESIINSITDTITDTIQASHIIKELQLKKIL